jgi:hypothetical protein
MIDLLDSDVIPSHPELTADKTAHVITKPSEAFIFQECKQLRDEIWTRVQDQRATERYILIAFALTYSFLLFHGTLGTAAKERTTAMALFIDELQYVPEDQLGPSPAIQRRRWGRGWGLLLQIEFALRPPTQRYL